MKLYRQEIKVHRGETFSIDKVIKNLDGSPYVISKELQNPHLLISIADSLYSQEGQYVKNYWLSLEKFPKFKHTTIFNLADLKNAFQLPAYNSFKDAELPLTGYYKGSLIKISADSTTGIEDSHVYYNEGEGYKYYDNGWKDYEFRFVKTFSQSDTREWAAQSYIYTIQIVAGQKTREYLTGIADKEGISYSNDVDGDYTDTLELFNKIARTGILLKCEDGTAPIIPDYSIPILKPTKLSVVEFAQGDKLW